MSEKTIQKVYPLTPMQEGMLYHSVREPESSFYFTQLELHISGTLDVAVLQKSVDQLVKDYDILRTVFIHHKLQRPRQVVLVEREAKVHFEDISDLESEHQRRHMEDHKRGNQAKGFNLAKDVLFRLAVFQLSAEAWHLVWSNHHIVMDGWSLGVLMKKLFQYYEAFRHRRKLQDYLERPYVDYIRWLEKQDKEEALQYWQQRLAEFDQSISLPGYKPPVERQAYENESLSFVWDEALVSSIKQVASRYQVTVPNLFQAVWGALVARYNNTDDVVYGTVVAGRPSVLNGIENMVGLFINTIPVRVQLERGMTFADMFLTMQKNALEAEPYDYVPLYEIQNRTLINQNLINHLLAFENYPLDRELENGNFDTSLGFSAKVLGASEQTNYDFNLIVFPGDQWTIKMMYNASVYERQWIEKVACHLTNLVRVAVRDPEADVSRVCFLADEEQNELLATFKGTTVDYPREKTIQSLFEEQAERVPYNVAVVFNNQQITYRELNEKANRLARVLRGRSVGPNTIVGVLAERSLEMIIGLMAILKAGGAYLPIDPAYPPERIQFMLEDSGVRLLLTQRHLLDAVEFAEILDLATTETHVEDASNLEPVNLPNDLSYIIYTSGTTGTPKGAMISHRNVVSLLTNDKLPFSFSEKDTWTMFHSFCFDFSVWEMYGALLHGGKLVVVPKHIAQSPNDFRELLIRENVTVLNQTPTAFSSFIQRELMNSSKQLGIRYVIFGGEALKPLMLKAWYEKYPETRLINMYGITETTVHVTFKEIGEEEIHSNISNIGVPLPTLGCYIMDKHLNLVPVGAIGELCVTGLGVARGYIHRPELSAERFIDNPYVDGERIYRSGDLARFLPNGDIEYFGRIDHQVKIRGFRIELGEIEVQLLKLGPIIEAAVLARPGRFEDQELYAYVVAEEQLIIAELRKALLANLPEYMVPTHIIQIPRMPITSNGKLDRKALPEPEIELACEEFQEPSSEREILLAGIWQDILGVKRVGRDDNFFALGGHSLKAMMLASKIYENFLTEVPINVLFERPTIRELATYLHEVKVKAGGMSETVDFSAIVPATQAEHYPVSSAQRRMYILSQLAGAATSYNLPAVLLLEGELDENLLEAAFQALINRHEILRTSFEMTDGALVQIIHESVPFSLDRASALEEEAETLIRQFIRPFDLQLAPLVRAQLVRVAKHRYLLLIDMHHIITDGVSTGILISDLADLYNGANLPAQKLHYKDFAIWQNNEVQQTRMKQLEQFWLDTFSAELPVLDLPTDFSRTSERSFAGERFDFGIDATLAKRIRQLTAETGTTTFMFLFALFNVFLSKYTSQEDIIVGSPVTGRMHPDIKDVPGMFVNTLALRSAPLGHKTFNQFLLEVKETSLQAFAHQDYPFEELVEKLPLNRDPSRNPLFDVMFNLLNMDTPPLQLGTLEISQYAAPPVAAKFDLTLEAVERHGEIDLSFDYATSLFTQETIRRWSKHLLQITARVVDNPDAYLSDIDMLSPEERQHLLGQCGGKSTDFRAYHTLHGKFEEQVWRSPDRVAVVDENQSLTYRELEERANRVAQVLRERGVCREDAVAICLDRSVDMVVAILAVLKSGGAYLPIDLDLPDARIRYMLDDSLVRGIITEQPYSARFTNTLGGQIIDIQDHPRCAPEVEALEPVNDPGDLAYVIYTSGTTGKPKGVMIEHRQVLHLVEALHKQVYSRYEGAALKVGLLAPFYFDASVQQIFASLLLGHTLVIVPKSATADGRALADYYRTHRVDLTDGTPSHLQMLLAAGNLQGMSMRHMLIGGEALRHETVRGIFDLFHQGKTVPTITNMYGPTECCVDASTFDIVTTTHASNRGSSYVPIGTPLGNNRLYILDAYDRLQPTGVAGELCIAGSGVGRGYLNLPELTGEKFVSDPFVPGETMYRTGDLVRRRTDGTIEFLGRMDHQVKVRGYRIELGEIESVMQKHEHIREVVVITNSGPGSVQDLYAYFTADKALSISRIRDSLSRQLPKYMVPSYFVQLESMPLTSNGKIDRRALPSPDVTRQVGTPYVHPTNDMEEQLCEVCKETLGLTAIGIDDNFFEVGGNSLKAMMLVGHIQVKLQRDIPLKALFERPTVRQMAQFLIESESVTGQTMIVPAEHRNFYPLSSGQKRIYILHQIEDCGVSYNMPSVLLLEGDLDVGRLERSLQALVERHETLRTSFTEVDGVPVQRIHEHPEFTLSVMQGNEEDAEPSIRAFIRPFDLASAPLFRAGVIRLSERRHLLLLDLHHIIADGISMRIFIRDMARLYKGERLEYPGLHYKDYTLWLNEPVQQERIQNQARHWIEQFTGDIPTLNLPTDFPRPPLQRFAGDVVTFSAAKETAKEIQRLAVETATTFHMVMLAVFNVFLSKMSGDEDIVVGSVAAGRMSSAAMEIPGMFVNTLALRSAPASDKTFLQFLDEVKETSLQSLANQDYPFEELISKLDLPRDMSRNPLFNVMLTTESPDVEAFTLDGLNLRAYDVPTRISKFDLTFSAFEGADDVGFQLEFATDLFKRETILRWSSYLLSIIHEVTANPGTFLRDIEVLTNNEKQQMSTEWNRTTMDVPTDKTIHQLFEAQVLRTPDNTAVTHNERRWTYAELNARANRLAHILINKGIRPDQRVGIMVKPSLEMAAGVLGILKAGAAFVPIDPAYPERRIAYVLEDSGAPFVLTQSELTVPAEYQGEVVLLDVEYNALTGEEDCAGVISNPDTATGPHHLAYVIYTSGTTGQPKGVMIEHRSLVNLCYWHNDAFAVSDQDRSTKYAGFGFDASVWEMFPYWLTGADLHILDDTVRLDIVRLNDYFERNEITIAFLPTQLCEQFMELENRSLRVLLTGGDKLKRAVKRPYTLVNNYGPTESTVVATSSVIEPSEGTPSIGKAIANTRVYILGPGNQLQPVGVIGELCIAGIGLARGYINRPEETENRFVEDPFHIGERMFRTGDLATWLQDGSIEYIGRKDQQVKVRGYRIELSEIEAHLAKHPLVQLVAVTDIQDATGTTALCAYVVLADKLQIEGVRTDLVRVLPDYMVPQYWVQVGALPLTHNGKLDRRALPKPDTSARTADYEAPRNDEEALLVAIWQEVLGIESIGVSDNFFALGGDSIKAIQLASRLYKHGWKLEMKDLFQHPTIAQTRTYMRRLEGKPASQGPVEGEVTLTPIQRWFFEQRLTNMHHWNQSIMLHASGGFDPQAVLQTVYKLVEQHDALRMVYRPMEGQFTQYNRGLEGSAYSLEVIDLRDDPDAANALTVHANQVQSSINLSEGPLVKVAQYKTPDGDHLLIVIHHLVVDGVSWRILLEDFSIGYLQAVKGQPIAFQEKTNSFQDWARELEAYANSEGFLRQVDFWRKVDTQGVLPLPKDNVTMAATQKDFKAVSVSLSEEETHLLLTKVHLAYGTEMNDILLSALGLTVREWTNERHVCVNLEGHGREEILPGINVSRTVGWFTTQYPIVMRIDHADDLSTTIKTVKEQLRAIPNKGVGYGILRYLTTEGQRSGVDFSLEPEISFNYLGQFDNEIETELFSPSHYDMGLQTSSESETLYALNFSGIVTNGRLIVSCSYDEKQYLRETMSNLIHRFKQHLAELIHHCAGKQGREFTPSDFTANQLEMDEVEDIFDLLTEKLS